MEYATYAYVTRPARCPARSWPPGMLLVVGAELGLILVFTPLLFPTGRLLSPRWRPVAWLAGVAAAAFTVLPASGRADADRTGPTPSRTRSG